jgi:DNA mismatch repair protein MLH1
MLNEYFSLDISADGQLIGLPMIIRDYRPQFEKLPMFLLRLGTEVDWESERGCFDGVAKELAIFYCAEPPASEVSQQDYFSQVEQLIFPCFKLRFHAPKKLNEYLTPLTSLHDLYKVFERC